MSFYDDFDEMFDHIESLDSKTVKRLQKEIDEIFENIKNGRIKGNLEKREINEQGTKGYIIRGYFESDDVLQPLEPLKPSKRRPLPERPIDLQQDPWPETLEPLADVFEEEDSTKVYVELLGEEKEDIHLNFREDSIEIRARNFYKIVDLQNADVNKSTAKTEYKNGVLVITIPKKLKLRREDAEKQRKV